MEGAGDIINQITKIASLFLILMSRPVFPEEIKLILNNKEKVVSVLSCMVLESRTLHYAHSDIILYSAQLEAINLDLSGPSATKYVGPIETYTSLELTFQLRKVFEKVNECDFGKAKSTVRNELAHVGRPKVMVNKLSIDDYVDIGHVLRLIVISLLLPKLGIDQKRIHQY